MPDIITGKIDLAKIHGGKVLRKDGRLFIELTDAKLFEGKNGALYLDLTLWPTPTSQYGDDWRINHDLPRALRDAGQKGAILGNAKNKVVGGSSAPAAAPAYAPPAAPAPGRPAPGLQTDINDEDVPF